MSNNEDLSSSSSLSSNLFKLSTPFQCFHHDLEYKNNKIIMTKKNTNDLLFNFNQPYQAQSFHQLPFKSKIIRNNNNNRNHPYNNSTTTTSSSRLDLESNRSIDNRIANSSVNSSNSILAHLKSLSPNFKSIFIRPKTHKPIDASSLLNKTKIHNKNVLSMETSRNNKNSSPFLTNLLPRIELKELRFNSSVDDILKKFTTEDDVIRRTIKNVTSSSTTLAATNNNRSTTTSVNKYKLDKQHSSFFITGILSSDESNDSSRSSTTTTMNQSHLKNSDLINNKSKWTCMICLSKHSTRLDVCSICGSSKSSSVTLKNIQEMTSPSSTTSSSSSSTTSSSTMTTNSNSNLASSLKKKQHQSTPLSSSTPSSSPSSKLFSSYLINELGLKQKLQQQQTILPSSEDESLRSTNKTPKKNPYNKKWSCLHCNYQNDNLKIVCLNCRWAKTMPPPSSKAMTETNLIDSSIKRSKKQSTFDNLLVTVDLTSDEKKNIESLKDKNNNVYCSSCKSPISKEKSSSPTKETTEIQSVTSSSPQIITEKSSTESTSFFVKQTSNDKKWNCTTCLVANLESNDKCVCCMTPKPNRQKLDETKTQISLKWTCDTCLVQNDADKNSCVCCMTPKPGASGSTKSASSSSLLPKFPETTNLLTTITSSNIKIGTTNNTSLPIKFDSVFKLPANTADQQQPANNKTFSFGLPSQSSEKTTSEKTTYSEPQVATPKFSFTPTSSSSLTNEKTPFSLSTPSSSNNNQLTFPSFSTNLNNKTDIPTFNTSMTNSNNNFFTANSTPKTDTTSTVNNNLPTLNFFSKPTDIAPNVTLTSNNLFGQTSFSTNNPSTFNSTTNLFSKPSFSNFSTQENNMPTFGNINTVPASSSTSTTTTATAAAAIQSFPLFDFKSSTATSFPNLNSQSKGFQFGSFNNTATDQTNNNSTSTTSFMPSLNPIINFVANPNAIIFSGNNETGMNSTAEVSSQRRFRKAIRKNR